MFEGSPTGTKGVLPGPTRLLLAAAAVFAVALAVALTGSPAEAAFPGTNGRIACEGLRGAALPSPPPAGGSRAEIFAVNPDGSGETVLTSNQTRDGDPVYSPDGKRVAFEGRRVEGDPSNSEIYVADNDGDLEGPDVRRLTFNAGSGSIPVPGGLPGVPGGTGGVSGTDRSPTWSPDGTQIAFHSGRVADFNGVPAADFEIYKMSAVSGEMGGLQRLTNNRGQDAVPSWSPDGTKIAFQSLRESTPLTSVNLEIFTMNSDGSGVTNISRNPGTQDNLTTLGNENSNGIDSFPTAWSPDGSQIAFGSTRANVTAGNQNFEIFKMNRDGSSPVMLTRNLTGDTPGEDGDYDHAPAWSPDGRRIVFTSGRSSTATTSVFDAYTMDADTGEAAGLQRVAATEIFARCDWQPIPRLAVLPLPVSGVPAPGLRPRFPGCPSRVANVIFGRASAESITGTPGADRIFAGAGNDTVKGRAGDDCIDLGRGADRGQGDSGADLILGGLGPDRLFGNAGNDALRGGASGDRLIGGSGNDRLHGQSGSDRIGGERGRDRVSGGPSNDVISGGSSGDRLSGDQGNDRIDGSSGNDALKGNSGRDRITGGSGRDRISGGPGNDLVSARDGRRDRVGCGSGRDTVVADRADSVSRDCERVRRR